MEICPQVESTPVLVEEIVVPVLTPEPEKEPEEEKKEEPAAPEPTPVEPVVRFLAKKNIPELTSNEKLSS